MKSSMCQLFDLLELEMMVVQANPTGSKHTILFKLFPKNVVKHDLRRFYWSLGHIPNVSTPFDKNYVNIKISPNIVTDTYLRRH
jgi:hypothetical protein